MQMTSRRYHFDLIATALHALTVIVACVTAEFRKTFTGQCLLCMEIVAFFFHLWYIRTKAGIGNPGVPRKAKWYEYGISATLGTIAVLHSPDRDPNLEWIILFFFIGNAQQLIGLQIDKSEFTEIWPAFIAGTLIQLGEYAFVGLISGVSVLYAIYVGFYALFGIHAFLRLKRLEENVGSDDDYTEEIYSFYGFIAKLAVFYADYLSIVGVSDSVISGIAAVVFVITVGYAHATYPVSTKYISHITPPSSDHLEYERSYALRL